MWYGTKQYLLCICKALDFSFLKKICMLMKTLNLKTVGPFLLLTFIYFIVGFLTTVNGQ